MMPKQKKKRVGIWIFLLAAPIPILVCVAIMQFAIRAAFPVNTTDCDLAPTSSLVTSSDNIALCPETDDQAGEIVFNIISLLAGIFAIGMLFGLPIWLIFLIRALNYNAKLKQQIQQPQPADQMNLPPQPPAPPQPPQPPVYPQQ